MLNTLNIPNQLRKKIDSELEPRESIRWIGQPQPKASGFIAAFAGVLLFAGPWTAFAAFWIWSALGYKLPNFREGIQPQHFFALFGVPFLLVGFAMLYTPFWGWYMAFQKVYIITDKRAIVFEGTGTTTIRSFTPAQLTHVYRREKNDGTGDVVISMRSWQDSDGDEQKEDVSFMDIQNPKQVERMLKDLADIKSA